MEWYGKTLRRTPNRSRAVLGLARGHAAAGDAAVSVTRAGDMLILTKPVGTLRIALMGPSSAGDPVTRWNPAELRARVQHDRRKG